MLIEAERGLSVGKTYFAVLGVKRNATIAEIRSAYRRLAKEFHPDHFEGGSDTFRRIQEAYSVLGNAESRREYERSLTPSPSLKVPVTPAASTKPEPLVPIRPERRNISRLRSFEPVRPFVDAGFERLEDDFSGLSRSTVGRVRNLVVEVPLARDQARRGGSVRLMAPARVVCPACGGNGGFFFDPCFHCQGEGAVMGQMPVSVDFPAGRMRDYAVTIPLDRLGLPRIHLTVLFRPADVDDIYPDISRP